MPSTAADTMPPAYPAPFPRGSARRKSGAAIYRLLRRFFDWSCMKFFLDFLRNCRKNFMRSVIFHVHAAENDGIQFDSAVCGRRNSLQEGFSAGRYRLGPAEILTASGPSNLRPFGRPICDGAPGEGGSIPWPPLLLPGCRPPLRTRCRRHTPPPSHGAQPVEKAAQQFTDCCAAFSIGAA